MVGEEVVAQLSWAKLQSTQLQCISCCNIYSLSLLLVSNQHLITTPLFFFYSTLLRKHFHTPNAYILNVQIVEFVPCDHCPHQDMEQFSYSRKLISHPELTILMMKNMLSFELVGLLFSLVASRYIFSFFSGFQKFNYIVSQSGFLGAHPIWNLLSS